MQIWVRNMDANLGKKEKEKEKEDEEGQRSATYLSSLGLARLDRYPFPYFFHGYLSAMSMCFQCTSERASERMKWVGAERVIFWFGRRGTQLGVHTEKRVTSWITATILSLAAQKT